MEISVCDLGIPLHLEYKFPITRFSAWIELVWYGFKGILFLNHIFKLSATNFGALLAAVCFHTVACATILICVLHREIRPCHTKLVLLHTSLKCGTAYQFDLSGSQFP
jgi:hypothetical protein